LPGHLLDINFALEIVHFVRSKPPWFILLVTVRICVYLQNATTLYNLQCIAYQEQCKLHYNLQSTLAFNNDNDRKVYSWNSFGQSIHLERCCPLLSYVLRACALWAYYHDALVSSLARVGIVCMCDCTPQKLIAFARLLKSGFQKIGWPFGLYTGFATTVYAYHNCGL